MIYTINMHTTVYQLMYSYQQLIEPIRYMSEDYVMAEVQQEFSHMIKKTFSVDLEQAEQLYRCATQ